MGHSGGELCPEGPPDTHSWAPPGSQISCSPAETYTWKSFRQYLSPRCWKVTDRTTLPRSQPSCQHSPRKDATLWHLDAREKPVGSRRPFSWRIRPDLPQGFWHGQHWMLWGCPVVSLSRAPSLALIIG